MASGVHRGGLTPGPGMYCSSGDRLLGPSVAGQAHAEACLVAAAGSCLFVPGWGCGQFLT